MKKFFWRLKIGSWKFGITNQRMRFTSYRDQIPKAKHRNRKTRAFKYAGERCEMCGKAVTYKAAELHHIVPLYLCPERAEDLSNMILLCHHCHRMIHANPFINVRLILEHNPKLVETLLPTIAKCITRNNHTLLLETRVSKC